MRGVFGQLCFTVVLFCSQSVKSLKDIPIDFCVHTNSNNQKLKDQFHYQEYKLSHQSGTNKLLGS